MEHASIQDVFSHRQTKAFKQRLSYWLKKGHSAEEALRRAGIRESLRGDNSDGPLSLVPKPFQNCTFIPLSTDYSAKFKPGRKPGEADENLEGSAGRKPGRPAAYAFRKGRKSVAPFTIKSAPLPRTKIRLIEPDIKPTSAENLISMETSLLLKSESVPTPLFLSQQSSEPAPIEIQREVLRLKRLGFVKEVSEEASEGMDSLSRPLAKTRPSPKTPQPFLLNLLAIFIVAGSTTILVRASASVFGDGWEGWLKAMLIEVSIIAVSIHKAPHLWGRLLSGLFLGVLVGLSLFVMHAAVLKDHSKSSQALELQSDELNGLTDLRQRLRGSLDAEPATHLTRRRELLADISRIEEKIATARSRLEGSGSVRALQSSSDVDMGLRVVLTLLNILFAGILRQAQPVPYQKIYRGLFARNELHGA